MKNKPLTIKAKCDENNQIKTSETTVLTGISVMTTAQAIQKTLS